MNELREETDIYSDLPSFKYDEILDKLQTTNKILQTKVIHLEELVARITRENEDYCAQCVQLSTNISSLFKTAQMEIRKKDNMIRELNQKLICFKVDKYSKYQKKRNLGAASQLNEEKKENIKSPKKNHESRSESVNEKNSNNNTRDVKTEKKNVARDIEEKSEKVSSEVIIPKIKCHTLYSKRMFNKIYNIDQNKEKRILVNVKSPGKLTDKEVIKEGEVDEKIKTLMTSDTSKVIYSANEEKPFSDSEIFSESNNKIIDRLVKPVLLSTEKCQSAGSLFAANLVNAIKDLTGLEISNSVSVKKGDDVLFTNSDVVTPVPMCRESQTAKSSTPVKTLTTVEINSIEENALIDSLSLKVNKNIVNRNSQKSDKNDITAASATSLTNCDLKTDYPSSTKTFESGLISRKCNNDADRLSVSKSPNKRRPCQGKNKSELPKSQFLSNINKLTKKSSKTTISPISSGWNLINQKGKGLESVGPNLLNSASKECSIEEETSDIVEALFGSPIKWTENSVDEAQTILKLTPPTAYEDSCSAQIENTRFKTTQNNVNGITKLHVTMDSSSDRKQINCPSKKSAQLLEDKQDISNIANLSSTGKDEKVLSTFNENINIACNVDKYDNHSRPFKEINNEKTVNFTASINRDSSEACDVPSSSNKFNQKILDSNISRSSPKNPKYQDSLLGQFDDTTQLICALAKGHSKLSPINTPIKDKCEIIEKAEANESSFNVSPDKNVKVVLKEVPLLNLPDRGLKNRQVDDLKESRTLSSFKISTKTVPIVSFEKKENKLSSKGPFEFEKTDIVPTKMFLHKQKEERKTVFLDQPINILCPRKTPRIVNRSSKQQQPSSLTKEKNIPSSPILNAVKEDNKISSIKEKEKEKDKGSFSIKKKVNFGSTEFIPQDCSFSCRKDLPTEMKKFNNVDMNRKQNIKNNSFETERLNIDSKTSKRNLDKNKELLFHDYSRSIDRKEKRLEIKRNSYKRSLSRKENSPRMKTEGSRYSAHIKNITFKKPVPNRTTFRRPNCNFRHSSLERKYIKDRRHSLVRKTPVRDVPKIPEPCSPNSSKENISKDIFSSRTHHIVRQSNSVWSATTSDVVSTKSESHECNGQDKNVKDLKSDVQEYKSIKWVLTPIDIDKNTSFYTKSSSPFGESSVRTKTPSPKVIDKIKSPNKGYIMNESYHRNKIASTPERSPLIKCPGIVIVSRKRPALFGVTEITDECSLKIRKEQN